MGQDSKIQWCHHTLNCWRGCVKVSDGCKFCYAEAGSRRNPAVLGIWGPAGTRVVAAESMWREPLKWDRAAKAAGERHRVFCASLADVFEDWRGPMVDSQGRVLYYNSAVTWWIPEPTMHGPIPMAFVRERLFELIAATPNLSWLLLTKRPENIARLWPADVPGPGAKAWPNLWLGTTCEDQANANLRIPELLMAPAAVRFLSCEPLLGPIDLSCWTEDGLECSDCSWRGSEGDELEEKVFDGGDPEDLEFVCPQCGAPCAHTPLDELLGAGINWVIVGGESGARDKARPCDLAWIRSIVEQCKAAGVPAFVKQLGTNPESTSHPLEGITTHIRFTTSDPKGGDWDEWSPDLRVRQFPVPEASRA